MSYKRFCCHLYFENLVLFVKQYFYVASHMFRNLKIWYRVILQLCRTIPIPFFVSQMCKGHFFFYCWTASSFGWARNFLLDTEISAWCAWWMGGRGGVLGASSIRFQWEERGKSFCKTFKVSSKCALTLLDLPLGALWQTKSHLLGGL